MWDTVCPWFGQPSGCSRCRGKQILSGIPTLAPPLCRWNQKICFIIFSSLCLGSWFGSIFGVASTSALRLCGSPSKKTFFFLIHTALLLGGAPPTLGTTALNSHIAPFTRPVSAWFCLDLLWLEPNTKGSFKCSGLCLYVCLSKKWRHQCTFGRVQWVHISLSDRNLWTFLLFLNFC